MTDESYSFSTARNRLEEIVTQVRKKDTSLEKSLDLLEEGVRLANACTELIDRSDWGTAVPASSIEPNAEDEGQADAAAQSETIVVDDVATIEDVVIRDEDGEFVAEVIEVTESEAPNDFEAVDDAWADESASEDEPESDEPSADER